MNESVPIAVAVITPVFGHSGLVMDALASVRALRISSNLAIHHVLVNDGCLDAATPAICVAHALECPELTHYIWQANAGLSSARNKGIDFALNELANLQAIFFLDADNALRNGSIDRAFGILKEDPSTSWVYPSIDMFGQAWNGDFGGDYSLLIHTHLNICEAGSLVHRRVFDSGLRFDENFKSGLEDWEFYLHAALRGFKGKYYREFGFRYRKRPESMLADSSRKMNSVLDQLRAKHAAAFNPRSRAEFEHIERPRYLHLHFFSEPYFSSIAAPRQCSGLSFDDLKLSFDKWRRDNRTNHFPPFVVATTVTETTLSKIAALLPGLMWSLEQHLSKSASDLVTVCFKESVLHVSIDSGGGDSAGTAHLYFFRSSSLLNEEFCHTTLALLGLCGEPRHHGTKQTNYVVSIPVGIAPEDTRNGKDKVGRLAEFLSVAARRHSEPVDFCWRSNGIANFTQSEVFLRHSFGGHEAFPFQPPLRASRSIGFLLPLVDFGGVEKVAINIASTLAAEGWEVHLFVAHGQAASLTSNSFSVFSSITFLGIDEEAVHPGGRTSYFGTATDFAVGTTVLERMVSSMYWLNSLINFHCPWAGQAINRLRSLGVRVFASLHVSDLTSVGRPVGNTYSALAFEHTYDYIITCSRSLYSWCLGMGFPKGKLILVQNSFGYVSNSHAALASKVVDVSLRNPLNVLYLGRFDHQKGMDRVEQIFFGSRSSRLPLNWKIVGKKLFPSAPASTNGEFSVDFAESVLEPVYESDALDALYQWAHIIIIPSRYEGLPLVLLEAMRFGVVPIATAVGAIEEMLESGVNGYMFEQDDFVTSALRQLELLCEEPDEFARLSTNAVRTVKNLSWERSCETLIGVLKAG